MTTVQMNTGDQGTYSRPLPWSPNLAVNVTNGIVSVNAEDVDNCVTRLGWQVMAGQTWTPAQRMRVPQVGSWPQTGNITLPDGSVAAASGGVVVIPKCFYGWATGFGFQPV